MKQWGKMFFGLFSRKREIQAVEALYQRISAASRAPFLYTYFGMPDTLEGRFDSLTLHAVLVLRRLRSLPPPADSVAQELVDILFREVDHSLREIGIGDLSIPKKMKVFAKTFYGRASLFNKAFEQDTDEALCEMLPRAADSSTKNLAEFASYVRQVDSAINTYDLNYILSDMLLFPTHLKTEQLTAAMIASSDGGPR